MGYLYFTFWGNWNRVDFKETGWIKMKFFLYLTYSFTFLFSLSGQELPLVSTGIESNGTSVPINSGDSNSNTNSVTQRSNIVETIERAGADLQNTDVGRRVGAAKLLGKYRNSRTSLLLVGALDDESFLVRRAAMVSLAEHASNGFLVYDKSLIEKIYSKLGDPDVEVRREVSTMIPRLVNGMVRSGMEIVEINGRKVYRAVPSSMRPDLLQLTLNAFLDEDAIVRQNVLKYHLYLKVPIPVSTLEKLLSDRDLGVLLTALTRISSNASQSKIVNRIRQLSVHEDKGIRLKVVSVARDCNRYHPEYRSILRKMTQDQDPEVLSMAAVELARFGERVPANVVEQIKQFLLEADGMTTQVTTILYAVSALGVDGVGYIKL